MAKNFQFKLEIKLYSFVNRNTENSILYIRDIYTMNQCFVTSVTEWLRGEGMSEKSGKTTLKFFIFCQNQIKKCELNCTEMTTKP